MTLVSEERLPVVRPRRLRRHRHRHRGEPVRISLWIPTTALAVLAAPLLVLALPVVNGVVLAGRLDPRAVGLLLRTILALSGTEVDVQAPGASVRLRLF